MDLALRRPLLLCSARFETARRIMSRHRSFQIWNGTRIARSTDGFLTTCCATLERSQTPQPTTHHIHTFGVSDHAFTLKP